MRKTVFEFVTSGMRAYARAKRRLFGKMEGMLEEKLKTGKDLFLAGIPLELIVEATKLSEQQIKKYVGICCVPFYGW